MPSLRDVRSLLLLGGCASIALVVFGVILAETLGIAACPLCIWQRILYLLYALLSLSGWALATSAIVQRGIALLMLATAATGAAIAGYQVWIQRFAPMTTCIGKEPWWEAFIRWAGEQVPLLFKASGLCSDPAWTFLSLSIADWSLLCFSAMMALAAYYFFKTLRRQRKG